MNLGTLWVDLKAQDAQFRASMASAQASAKGLTTEAAKAQTSWRTAFESIGRSSHILLGVGTSIEGIFGLAVYQAGKLNQAMSDLQSVMKLNGNQIDILKGKAIEYSKAHMIGASEITKAYYDMASAGMNYEQIVNSVEQTATLATATFGSMAEATDIMTDAMNTYVKEMPDYLSGQEKANRVTNIFAGAVQQFKIILPQLRAGLANVTSTAYAMHIPLQDVVTQLGLLKNAGMSAEEAGTALNRAYMSAPKLFKNFGINALDAAGHMRPLADILDELKVKLGGAIDTTAEMTKMQTTFGIRGVKVAEILMNETDAMRSYSKYLVESNSATEMAEAREKGFNAQMKILWNNIKDLGAEVGSVLIPVVEKIVGFIKGIVDGFESLDPHLQQAIVMITAFGGAGAVLVGVLGSLMGAIPGLIAGFSALAVSPFGWVAGAVIGITALVGWIESQKKAYDDLIVSTDKLAKSQKAEADNETALLSEYKDLAEKTSLNADQKTHLRDISQKLAELAPQSIKSINDETGAWNLNVKAIDEDIKKRQELAKLNAEKALKEAQKRLDASKEQLKFTKEGIQYVLKEITALQNTASAQERIKKNQEELAKLQKEYNGYKKQEWKLNNDYNKGLLSITELEQKKHELAIKESETLVKIGALQRQNRDLAANATADAEKKQAIMSKYQNQLVDLTKQEKEQSAEVAKQQKAFDEAQKSLNDILGVQKKVTTATDKQESAQAKVTEELKNTVTSLTQLKDVATKYAESGKELEMARQNLNMSDLDYYKAKQSLLKSTITDISKIQVKVGSLSDADKKFLDVLKNAYKTVSDKVASLDKKQSSLNTTISSQKDVTAQLAQSLKALNDERGVTLDQLGYLNRKLTLYTNAYNALAEKKAKNQKLTKDEVKEYKLLPTLIKGIKKALDDYSQSTDKTNKSVLKVSKGIDGFAKGLKNVIEPFEKLLKDVAKKNGFNDFQKDIQNTTKALKDGKEYYKKTGDLLGTLKMNAMALSNGINDLNDNISKNGATKAEIEQLKEWQTQLENTKNAIDNMEAHLQQYNSDVSALENIDFKLSLTSDVNQQIPLLKQKLETLAKETRDIKYINLKPEELKSQLESITKDVYNTTQNLVSAIGTMYKGSTDDQLKALRALQGKLKEVYKDNPVALKASLGIIDNAIKNTIDKAKEKAKEAADEAKKAAEETLKEWQSAFSATANLLDSIGELTGADYSTVSSGLNAIASGIQIVSAAIETSAGPVGWVIAGIQLVADALNFMAESEKNAINGMVKLAESTHPKSFEEFKKEADKANGVLAGLVDSLGWTKEAWKKYADEVIKQDDKITKSVQDLEYNSEQLSYKMAVLGNVGLSKKFDELSKSMKPLSDKIADLNKQFEEGKITQQEYEKQLAKLTIQEDKYKEQLQTLSDLANAYSDLDKAMKENSDEAEILGKSYAKIKENLKKGIVSPEEALKEVEALNKIGKSLKELSPLMEGNGAKASVLRKKYAEFKEQLAKMGDKVSNEWIKSQIDGIKKLGQQIDQWQQTLTSGLESALTKYVNFFDDMSKSQKTEYMKEYLEKVKHLTFESTEAMKEYYDKLSKSEKASLDKGLHDYLNKTVRYDTFKKAFDSTLKKAVMDSLIQSLVTQGIIGKKVQELAAFISVAMKDGLSKGELDTIKYMMQGIEKESQSVGDAISDTMDNLKEKGTTSTKDIQNMIKDYLGKTEDDTKSTTEKNTEQWDGMAQKVGDSVSMAIEKMLEKFGLLPLKAKEITDDVDTDFRNKFGDNGTIVGRVSRFVDIFKRKLDFNPFGRWESGAGNTFSNISNKFNQLIGKMRSNATVDINVPKITTPTISPSPVINTHQSSNSQLIIQPGAIQVNESNNPQETADTILDKLSTEITRQRQTFGGRLI